MTGVGSERLRGSACTTRLSAVAGTRSRAVGSPRPRLRIRTAADGHSTSKEERRSAAGSPHATCSTTTTATRNSTAGRGRRSSSRVRRPGRRRDRPKGHVGLVPDAGRRRVVDEVAALVLEHRDSRRRCVPGVDPCRPPPVSRNARGRHAGEKAARWEKKAAPLRQGSALPPHQDWQIRNGTCRVSSWAERPIVESVTCGTIGRRDHLEP